MTIALCVSVAVAFAGVEGHAQTVEPPPYPSRPITLIVPFERGGSTDVTARILAERMAPLLGQPIAIENVAGAGGTLGVARLARSRPDGYTIDLGQWDTHVGSVIYSLTYDPEGDFAPIGLASINPQLLVARKNLPADDMKSLVAWIKSRPGDVRFVNQNAAAEVSGLLMQKLTGSQVLFVPYRGAGPAMTDLRAGKVDLMVAQGAVTLPQIRDGAIKALVNLSPHRSAAVPDIPTSYESGVPGLYISGWFGLFAPRGTPTDAIQKIDIAMIQTLADPSVQARFIELGMDIAPRQQQTPEGLDAFQKAEIKKWWPVVKTAGISGR